jgi:AcrR family transcriptional regulator
LCQCADVTSGLNIVNPDLGRRERRKLEVRNRILEASFSLFEQKGIEATKVLEICERADVARKTFFNYFPSKRHLLREIAHASLFQLLLDLEEVRKHSGSSEDRILFFFEKLADNADEAGPMHRELLTEFVHVAHESGTEHEQARKLHAAFAAVIAEGRDAGDLSDQHSAETQTEMLMGAFYVLMFNWANLDAYPLRQRALATARFLADAMVIPGASATNPSMEESK